MVNEATCKLSKSMIQNESWHFLFSVVRFFMEWMSFFLGQIGSIVPRDYEKSMFMHFIQTEIQQKF